MYAYAHTKQSLLPLPIGMVVASHHPQESLPSTKYHGNSPRPSPSTVVTVPTHHQVPW